MMPFGVARFQELMEILRGFSQHVPTPRYVTVRKQSKWQQKRVNFVIGKEFVTWKLWLLHTLKLVILTRPLVTKRKC